MFVVSGAYIARYSDAKRGSSCATSPSNNGPVLRILFRTACGSWLARTRTSQSLERSLRDANCGAKWRTR